MGRSRNIKPGFFTNDELVELPFEYRILFAGLWTIADREGRLADRPKKIKLDIFPGDDVDCVAGLNALVSNGFLERYEIENKKYIQVLNWHKHQKPHHKEAASQIPAKPEMKVIESEGEIKKEEIKHHAQPLDEPSTAHESGMDESCMVQANFMEIASCPTDSLQSDSLQSDCGIRATTDQQADHSPTEKITVLEIPKARNLTAHDLITDLPGLSIGVAQDWILHRRNKKSPLTESAWKSMLVQIGLIMPVFSLTADQVLAEAMEAGWQTVKLPWMKNRLGDPATQQDTAEPRRRLQEL